MTQFTHLSGLPQLQQLTTKEIKGRRHYLLPDGSYVPSVTTVLGFFKSRSLMEWRTRVGEEEAQKITTQASIRGTKFRAPRLRGGVVILVVPRCGGRKPMAVLRLP